jgi:hypothetical protein
VSAGLAEIERLLAEGDVAAARERLRELEPRERDVLSEELGEEPLRRAERSATRVSRGSKRRRVVVIPGIMGSLLDVRRNGDADRIWLKVLRLARGRFGDLELGLDGAALGGGQVEVAGLHRSYLPLILHLDQDREVLPFAYDWRMDIDASGDRLASRIGGWARGERVDIVAHAMGGLVARSMMRRHPDLWAAMGGGRLIMLGTPNKGSYAIPLTLVGQEWLLKVLGLVDVRHDRRELGRIVGTFPGAYGMLPSPHVDLDDDHVRLYSPDAWGDSQVARSLLDRAREFHTRMNDVIDPERLVYVAGYGRRTPHLVRVVSPGELEFKTTRLGDGRVTHELGLLDDVQTYFVDEGHGGLTRADRVLDALAPLLDGEPPDTLSEELPATTRAAETRGWLPAARVDPEPDDADLDPQLRSIQMATRGSDDTPTPDDAIAEARVAREMARWYLGEPSRGEPEEAAPPKRRRRAPAPAAPTTLGVAWGSITEMADCDVVAVGHYQGVLPQNAELALDVALSAGASERIITEQTRRGLIQGGLGTVTFLPWPSPRRPGRVVAICGMGRPGTFGEAGLRRLVQNLIWASSSLPGDGRVCSVLIGSGEGTLTIEQATSAWVAGVDDAIRNGLPRPLAALTIVERDRGRARRILAAFRSAVGTGAPSLTIEGEEPEAVGGGVVGAEDAFALAVALMARALGGEAERQDRSAARRLLAGLRLDAEHAEEVRGALEGLVSGPSTIDDIAQSLEVSRRAVAQEAADEERGSGVAERVSFIASEEGIRAAAITNTTTVAERLLPVGTLIQELTDRMTAELDPNTRPPAVQVDKLGGWLRTLIVPHEFHRIIATKDVPLVVEVDRTTGQLHWEALPGADGPVAISRPTARQLRTTRSPAPAPPRPGSSALRVLILGDPGSPADDPPMNLEGARREALGVVERLRQYDGVEVVALIGSPSGPEPGFAPADRLTALMLLQEEDFDIVHYSGHGDFDPKEPDRAGWRFEGGKLTAREFRNTERLPALIVANACLTGRFSTSGGEGREAVTPSSEAALLPSLADAFFQHGVRDYVGTAWEVSDRGAVLFAETLYGRLLGGASIGAAVRAARRALWDESERYGSLWLAYQHYGDPTPGNVLRRGASRSDGSVGE